MNYYDYGKSSDCRWAPAPDSFPATTATPPPLSQGLIPPPPPLAPLPAPLSSPPISLSPVPPISSPSPPAAVISPVTSSTPPVSVAAPLPPANVLPPAITSPSLSPPLVSPPRTPPVSVAAPSPPANLLPPLTSPPSLSPPLVSPLRPTPVSVAAQPPPADVLTPVITSPSSSPRLLSPPPQPSPLVPSRRVPPTPLRPSTFRTPPCFPTSSPTVSPSTLKSPPPLLTASPILLPFPGPSDTFASPTLTSPSSLPSSFFPNHNPGSKASPPLQLPLVSGSLPKAEHSHVSTVLIVTGLISGVILVILLGVLCIFCRDWRRKKNKLPLQDYTKPPCLEQKDKLSAILSHCSQENVPPQPPLTSNGYRTQGCSVPKWLVNSTNSSRGTFTYGELAIATNGFSPSNILGQGGFGYVYKGVLKCGKEVAVKQLKTGSRQGEREFQAEVETISHIHHKHPVTLVGYCITGAERLLVYEFFHNNSMEFHLHGEKQAVMEWETRVRIAIGSAKGLAYLHEDCSPTIIHRDIKASNILLDSKLEAKVSDFGLAKILSDTKTHISTRVVGTFGYLAPEYASSGKLTEKSDVYSYGITLLELITGRPPITTNESMINQCLIDWARPLLSKSLEDGNFEALVDPKLRNFDYNEMASMVACAAACVRHSAWLRPKMSQIVRALEGDVYLEKLDGHSTNYTSSGSLTYNAHQYSEILTSTSRNYGTSRYSESTSEYGLNPSGSSSRAQQTN